MLVRKLSYQSFTAFYSYSCYNFIWSLTCCLYLMKSCCKSVTWQPKWWLVLWLCVYCLHTGKELLVPLTSSVSFYYYGQAWGLVQGITHVCFCVQATLSDHILRHNFMNLIYTVNSYISTFNYRILLKLLLNVTV